MANNNYGDVPSIDMIGCRFGSRPIATGAATKTFTAQAYGMKVLEDTTITHFVNKDGTNVITHWESIVIPSGETIWFGALIKSIVVTVGGKGQYYLAESDF